MDSQNENLGVFYSLLCRLKGAAKDLKQSLTCLECQFSKINLTLLYDLKKETTGVEIC